MILPKYIKNIINNTSSNLISGLSYNLSAHAIKKEVYPLSNPQGFFPRETPLVNFFVHNKQHREEVIKLIQDKENQLHD